MSRRGLLQIIGQEVYLLDDFGGSATAFSLRYLSSAFVGSDVILVRRSSDNAEQGFTPTEITDGTLTTFTGAGNGFVKTWYDQSGNTRNATQLTAGSQPQIVDTGALVTENGLPTIKFATNFLQTAIFTLEAQPLTRIIVTKQDSNNFGYMLDGSSSNRGIVGTDAAYVPRLFAGTVLTLTAAGSNAFLNQSLIYSFFDDTNSEMFIDGLSVGIGKAGAQGLDQVTIGVSASTLNTQNFSGNIQEIVIYPSDETANQTGIQTNINDYYTIF